jgi:hypothetical protein
MALQLTSHLLAGIGASSRAAGGTFEQQCGASLHLSKNMAVAPSPKVPKVNQSDQNNIVSQFCVQYWGKTLGVNGGFIWQNMIDLRVYRIFSHSHSLPCEESLVA